MSVRSLGATVAGRLVHWTLHDVLHRPGAQLPGRVALTVDPQLIAHLRAKARLGTVVVCGTNGKTTTTNLVAAVLEATGARVLCNRDGANMMAGVASALLPGRTADFAVLEADELSTIHILPQLQPTYLVLLNLFRDQLDRAGELDHVQDTIVEALAASPRTTLVVCGDDPLCMGVAERARATETRVLAFGIEEDLGLPADRVPEARFCQRCGAELAYAYRSYAQLGAFACPNCSFARPALAYAARAVAVEHGGVAFDLHQAGEASPVRLRAPSGGVYLVYNLLAMAAMASLLQVPADVLQPTIEAFDPHNGRLQRFVANGREVVLNLAKNPTGLNQNIALLLADERPKVVHVVVNDEANDGHDISWIWDVDFERLAGQGDELRVLVGGHRANDLQVRLKYADIEAALATTVEEALALVADVPCDRPLYVLTNYSALRPTKDALERLGERHG